MSLAVLSSSLAASSNSQELHEHGRRVAVPAAKLVAGKAGRRGLLLSSTATTILLAGAAVAFAAEVETSESQTALLQKYLKKSEENKEKNDKERVENYYKRNYQDYFKFMEGTLRAKDAQQLSESEKGILAWLDKNK